MELLLTDFHQLKIHTYIHTYIFSINYYLFFLFEPLVMHKWVSCCPTTQLDNLATEHCLRVWLYNNLYAFKREFTCRKVIKKYNSEFKFKLSSKQINFLPLNILENKKQTKANSTFSGIMYSLWEGYSHSTRFGALLTPDNLNC